MNYSNKIGSLSNPANKRRLLMENLYLNVFLNKCITNVFTKYAFGQSFSSSNEVSIAPITKDAFLKNQQVEIQNITAKNGLYNISGATGSVRNIGNNPDMAVQLLWETYQCTQDWGGSVSVEIIDGSQSGIGINQAFSIVKGQRIVSQVDAFRFSRIYRYAAIAQDWLGNNICNVRVVDITDADFSPLAEVDVLDNLFTETNVDTVKSDDTLFVTPKLYTAFKNDKKVVRAVQVDGANDGFIKREVVKLDTGLQIQKVRSDLMKENFGAYSATRPNVQDMFSSGRQLEYIRVANSTLISAVIPLDIYKEFTAEQRVDSWVGTIQTRMFHDIFIDRKSRSTVIVGIAPLATNAETKKYITSYIKVARANTTVANNQITEINDISGWLMIEKGSTPAFASSDTDNSIYVNMYEGVLDATTGKYTYPTLLGSCYVTSDGTVPTGAPTGSTVIKGTINNLVSSYNDLITTDPGGLKFTGLTIKDKTSVAFSTHIGKADQSDLAASEIDVRCIILNIESGIGYNDRPIYGGSINPEVVPAPTPAPAPAPKPQSRKS